MILCLMLFGTIVSLGWAVPSEAQEVQDVRELQRVIETQQKQLDALRNSLSRKGKCSSNSWLKKLGQRQKLKKPM